MLKTLRWLIEEVPNAAQRLWANKGKLARQSFAVVQHFTPALISSFIGKVSSGVVAQAKAIPRYIKSLRDPNANQLFRNTVTVVIFDVAPVIVSEMLWNYFSTQQTEKEDEKSYFFSFIRQGCFLLINSSGKVLYYSFVLNRKCSSSMRIIALTVANSKMYQHAARLEMPKEVDASVCHDCTTGRHLKGEARSLVVFIIYDILFACLRKTPWVGTTGVNLLMILLKGQLYLDYVLASNGICDRHRAIYFQEYTELLISIGVTTTVVSSVITTSLDCFLGVRGEVATGTIESVIGLLMVGVLHNTELPEPVAVSERNLELLGFIRQQVADAIDVLVKPGKKMIQKMVEGKQVSDLPFADFISRNVRRVVIAPSLALAGRVVLPANIQSLEGFGRDPVIRPYFKNVAETLVSVITIVEETKQTWTGWFLLMLPSSVTSKGVNWLFHIPGILTKLALKVANSSCCMSHLVRLRNEIKEVLADKLDEGWMLCESDGSVQKVIVNPLDTILIKLLDEMIRQATLMTPYVTEVVQSNQEMIVAKGSGLMNQDLKEQYLVPDEQECKTGESPLGDGYCENAAEVELALLEAMCSSLEAKQEAQTTRTELPQVHMLVTMREKHFSSPTPPVRAPTPEAESSVESDWIECAM